MTLDGLDGYSLATMVMAGQRCRRRRHPVRLVPTDQVTLMPGRALDTPWAVPVSVIDKRNVLGNEIKRAKRLGDEASAGRVVAARRELAAAKIEKYIRAVINQAPELTATQKDRLALLLRGTTP